MSSEQQPDLILSRRGFVAGCFGGTLAVLWPESAEAEAPSPRRTATTAVEQGPTTVSAEAEITQAGNSLFDQAKEFMGPFSAVVSSLIATSGLVFAVRQWREQKATQAAANERQAESDRYAQLTAISDLLHSTNEADRNKGAERLVMTMARSPSPNDQLQVFQMVRGALKRRKLPNEGLVRLGDYESNLIEAFFLVLPAVRASRELHKPAFVGPQEEMQPNIDAEGINLAGAKLFGQDLRNMHMSRGNFRDTRFQNSTLGSTNFNGCDMRGAIFIHLSRTNTDFGSIWFQHADLRGAIFRSNYLDNPTLFKNIAVRTADIKGLILLGDSALSEDQVKVLTNRGAIYVPNDHPEYHEYYNLTRTPKPSSLDNRGEAS